MLPDGTVNLGSTTSFQSLRVRRCPRLNARQHWWIGSRSAGWKRVLVRPHPSMHPQWGRASRESPRGRIESSWRIEDDRFFILDVTIPTGIRSSMPTSASCAPPSGPRLRRGGGSVSTCSGTPARCGCRAADSVIHGVGQRPIRSEVTAAGSIARRVVSTSRHCPGQELGLVLRTSTRVRPTASCSRGTRCATTYPPNIRPSSGEMAPV